MEKKPTVIILDNPWSDPLVVFAMRSVQSNSDLEVNDYLKKQFVEIAIRHQLTLTTARDLNALAAPLYQIFYDNAVRENRQRVMELIGEPYEIEFARESMVEFDEWRIGQLPKDFKSLIEQLIRKLRIKSRKRNIASILHVDNIIVVVLTNETPKPKVDVVAELDKEDGNASS